MKLDNGLIRVKFDEQTASGRLTMTWQDEALTIAFPLTLPPRTSPG